MIKKTLIIIILYISTVECSSIRNKKISESLYDKILNEIVVNNVFKLDNIKKTRISKEIIPFNTISTDIGFINKNIIENRLYVELRKFNYLDTPTTSPSSEILSYGLCHSYLYEVKKNKLKLLSYGYYDLN